MIEPFKGRIYDPCCGSGGMFVQSAEFLAAHGGGRDDLAIYGQEFVAATWRLARMNLALRGIEANLGTHSAETFHRDLFPDLRADFILANPPFNKDDWFTETLREDVRWKFGVPPTSNANFAWVQHIVHHLAPSGVAGLVLANGSLSSTQGGEGPIRQALVEADLVDCIVAMPEKLFFNTGIPVCLWFITKNRASGSGRDRRGEVLFIDARGLGHMETRTVRAFDDDDIARVVTTYQAWRGKDADLVYEDVAGFSRAVPIEEIAEHSFVLNPGRYVGAEQAPIDTEPTDEKITRLRSLILAEFDEADRLEKMIRSRLEGMTGV
ncbi:N-6 DNA methylase [Aquihabitans sp. G128]|uniref:N-6 DNA methylase n=1 Tax=Aquihabitans sp. G128 TaxID=2849779 RepID=UPI0020B2C678|nr:N-6 DNA methylase [Aquihabitans sp. G128]